MVINFTKISKRPTIFNFKSFHQE